MLGEVTARSVIIVTHPLSTQSSTVEVSRSEMKEGEAKKN